VLAKKRALLALVVVTCMVGTATAAMAATTVGRDIRLTGATKSENNPDVVWNPTAGQYLLVWMDSRSHSTRGWDVYSRLLRADGDPIGDYVRLSGAKADALYPAAARNQTDNEYFVVWQDARKSGTRGWEIYGRRVGADGRPVGAEIRISRAAGKTDETMPAVAWSASANQYLVVWQDFRNGRWDIYGQRLGGDGTHLGGNFRISGPGATGHEQHPAVAWNHAWGQYLVVWDDDRLLYSRHTDIYGRRVGTTGSPVGDDIRISRIQDASRQEWPALACPSGECLVVWEDWRNAAGRSVDIYGRRVGPGGKPSGGDFRICGAKAITYDSAPTVAWSWTFGRYLVAWRELRNSAIGQGADIYGQQVSAAGERIGPDFRISGRTNASLYSPAMAWNDAADQFLVVWSDERKYGLTRTDIYGKRVAG